MHATISKQLLDTASGTLLIPDVDIEDGNAPIRITRGTVEYVAKDEITALFDALDMLGLSGFDSLDFSIITLFANVTDFDQLLASASIQATISDLLLPGTPTELTMVAGNAALVIPTVFRDAITVDGAAKTQIDGAELALLLEGMNALGLGSYDDALNPATVTDLEAADIDAILLSGSMHVTLYNMLRGNGNITTPNLAKEVNLYGVAGITKAVELRNFIVAVNAFGGNDFSGANFTVNGILLLTPGDRTTVITSMIVRDSITDDIETLDGFDPFFTLVATDYMENNAALFLSIAGIERYLNYAD